LIEGNLVTVCYGEPKKRVSFTSWLKVQKTSSR